MRCLESIAARFPLVGCCCSQGVEEKEEMNQMELARSFRWKPNTGVAPGTGRQGLGAVSPARLPSTRLATGRPVSPAPSILSSLAITDQTVLRSERKNLGFTVGVKVIPHPEKVAKGGEDAYFISSYNGGVLGVADGVSGWAEENVDPALFSRELMAHALAKVESEEVRNDPRRLLAKAHSATASIGAATAIIAMLEKNGMLHVANLGDCGLRIVRQGKVVYATMPQQHFFDCPFQLSSENAQTADDATVYELGVLEGDTIIMGSDGLFDNVYDSEIETTMQILSGADESLPSRAAIALASLACKHAQDRNFDSPYAKEAIAQGHDLPWWYKALGKKIGGKIDDITVVVGQIVGRPISAEDEVISENGDTAELAREHDSTEEQVSAEGQISAERQAPAEEQVSTKERVAAEGQVSTEEQVSTEGQVFTEEQVSADEHVSTEGQASTEEQVSTKERVAAEGQVSTEEQVSADEHVSTEGQASTEEQVSAKEQEVQV